MRKYLFLSLVLFPLIAGAEEPVDLFISAGVFPVNEFEAPDIAKIEAEQLENSKPRNAEELFSSEAGLHFDQAGGPGGLSSIYLRGADPNFTVIMVDGVKLNDPTDARGGSLDFSTFDLQSIERVEVLKGASSSIHGSDALAGVINIITKKSAEDSSTRIRAEGGTFEFASGSVQTHQNFENTTFGVSSSATNGGDEIDGDRLWRRNLSGYLVNKISDSVKFGLNSRWELTDSSSFPDDSGGPEFAVNRNLEHRDNNRVSVSASLDNLPSPEHEYKLQVSYMRSESEINSPGVAPGARDPFGIPENSRDTTFERYSGSATYQHIVSSSLKLALGGEYQFEDGKEEGVLNLGDFVNPTSFSLDRSITSGFFELISEPVDELLFRAGVRVDKPESFSTRGSPSASLAYTVSELDITLFGKYGEGFKLPSFFALGNSIVGNPDLRPEKSETYEVGLKHLCDDIDAEIRVSWFHTTYEDAIDFDEGPPPLLINQSEIVSQGFELSGNIQLLDSTELIISTAYVDSEIKDSDDRLRNRPDWKGSVALNIQPTDSTNFNLAGRYTSSRFDSSIPNPAVDLDSFIVVDSSLSVDISEVFEVWLAINNLLDEDYEHFDGFPAKGINARAGIGAEF